MFRSRLKSAPPQTILVYEDLAVQCTWYLQYHTNDFVFLRKTEIVGDRPIKAKEKVANLTRQGVWSLSSLTGQALMLEALSRETSHLDVLC